MKLCEQAHPEQLDTCDASKGEPDEMELLESCPDFEVDPVCHQCGVMWCINMAEKDDKFYCGVS